MVLGGSAPGRGVPLGPILLAAAALTAGFYNVFSRRLAADFTPLARTTVMMWAGAVVFGLAAAGTRLAAGRPLLPAAVFQSAVIIALGYLGLLSSVAAFFLVNYVLGRMPTARAASFANLTMIISVAAGALLLGEEISWYHWLGGVLILAGVWGINAKDRMH